MLGAYHDDRTHLRETRLELFVINVVADALSWLGESQLMALLKAVVESDAVRAGRLATDAATSIAERRKAHA